MKAPNNFKYTIQVHTDIQLRIYAKTWIDVHMCPPSRLLELFAEIYQIFQVSLDFSVQDKIWTQGDWTEIYISLEVIFQRKIYMFLIFFSSTSHILDFIAGCLYRSGEIYYENIKKIIFFSQDTLHLKHFFCFSELCVEKGVWFLKIQFCKRFLSECPIIRM